MTRSRRLCATTASKCFTWKTSWLRFLEANPELREQFLKQWIEEAGIRTDRYQKIIFDYMQENYPDAKDFVLKTMEASTSPSCTPTSPTRWWTWFPSLPRWSSSPCRTCTSPATRSR